MKPVLELRVALTAKDYETVLKFYTDGLGLEPAELWISENNRGAGRPDEGGGCWASKVAALRNVASAVSKSNRTFAGCSNV